MYDNYLLIPPKDYSVYNGALCRAYIHVDGSVYWSAYIVKKDVGQLAVLRSTKSGERSEFVLSNLSTEGGALNLEGSTLFVDYWQNYGGTSYGKRKIVEGFIPKYIQDIEVTFNPNVVVAIDTTARNIAQTALSKAENAISLETVDARLDEATKGLWQFVLKEARPAIKDLQEKVATTGNTGLSGLSGLSKDEDWAQALNAQYWALGNNEDTRNLLRAIIREEVKAMLEQEVKTLLDDIVIEDVENLRSLVDVRLAEVFTKFVHTITPE